MSKSTLTTKGQITIPKKIRDQFDMRPGDVLEFTADDEGRILVRPARPGGALGCLGSYARKPPVSVEDMHRAVRERVRGEAGNRG